MKYYVVADVHGFYSILKQELQDKGFFDDTEAHKLIICGDLFDRGKEAVALQDFILELMQKDEVILIRGNHEDLLLQMLESMEIGQLWSFDLIAAPTKKVALEGKKNSQRRILRLPQERQEWLERKAAQNGFSIIQAQEQEQLHVSGKHKADKGGVMYHDAYHYQGILQITDADAFRKALETGIGSGKSYGFGMMMVKRL
jgi:CRISPR-associated protein Cas6/Cse3/CasE subtype I-E